MRTLIAALALLAALPLPATGSGGAPARPAVMARVPAGSYLPLYAPGGGRVRVAAFELDRYPVTRGEYLRFVRDNPRWRRGAAKPLFVGAGYLAGWRSALDAGGPADLERPATEVSWFAAKAYCRAQGKRLPTSDEWEYAAAAGETARDATRDPRFNARLLGLYTARRNPRAPVGSTFRNAYGVWDLHGLVWEWVGDFNNVVAPDDSRSAGAADHQLNCAGGAVG
ncbi:MAG TPA: formylglycine-generating enzyme family protein, partial [Longimicrobiaceae bacterium]|nr:formylglycine-generating enzyme family protein [Longimicrobiaceae bacterium]